jgi:hypothetical protein
MFVTRKDSIFSCRAKYRIGKSSLKVGLSQAASTIKFRNSSIPTPVVELTKNTPLRISGYLKYT